MQQSENINDLATALCVVQGELEGAKKDSSNPFFKSDYADLQSVWECCRSLLSKNGLCVIQTNGGTAESPSVITTLAHISGQWIRGELHMTPDKKGPQGTGSAITYARRYALAAIVGIYQVDDDAEGATNRDKKPPKQSKSAGSPEPTVDSPAVVSKVKAEAFLSYAQALKIPEEKVNEFLTNNFIESVYHIPVDRYDRLREGLKSLKEV
ncbi:MAG: ERF family protein [Nitrosopumilus sp.]|nr:ERF family protein [Nitrosopumilus sp.]